MKGRGVLLIVVFGAGVATGYYGAQKTVQDQLHELVMTSGSKIEEQLERWLQQVKGKELSPGARTNRTSPQLQEVSPELRTEYMRNSVQIRDLTAQRDPDGGAAIISGKLNNTGDRALSRAVINIYFMGTADIVFETRLAVMPDGSIAPGASQEFDSRLENVPAEWAGKIRATVVEIQL